MGGNKCETEEVLKNRLILTVLHWKNPIDGQVAVEGPKDIDRHFGQKALAV